MTIRFRDIKFGFASAEQEGAANPELLLDGYFQLHDTIDEACNGSKFLFLGYKGSGKSAIGEHLRLLSRKDSNLFVTNVSLADFPYSQLKEVVWGDAEPESKYPTAWSWLVLLTLFESFSKDVDISSGLQYPEYARVMDALRDTGLLPLPTWRQVILATSKRSFRINLPPELASELERGIHERGLQVQFFVDKLRMVSQGLRTSTRHLVVIDGLDDILTNRKAQFDALAALVLETNRLNLAFQRSQVKAKVIVLCRTDLFEKLPGANKNKIRQDSAVHLDWYQDPRQPEDSSLVKLVSLRAQLADPSIVNLFETYFPSQVEGRDIVTFLLELTRHTPRDFIQILRHVQQFAGPLILTRDQVLSGTRSYSINYFLPEIRDELVGYVSDEDVEATVALIGSLRKRDFYLDELQSKSRDQERYARVNLPEVISALFECSALGNLRSSGATTYYTFKFRNRNSTLNLEDRLILHRGMWKAMNLA